MSEFTQENANYPCPRSGCSKKVCSSAIFSAISARNLHRTTCPAVQKYFSDEVNFCRTCPMVRRSFVNTDYNPVKREMMAQNE